MKPTLDTPDTVVVGLYSVAGEAAATGTLLTLAGDVRPDVLAVGRAATWPALAAALGQAEPMLARHLLLLTNDAALVEALTPPIRAPVPTAFADTPIFFTEWEIGVGYGGDEHHWQVLRLLGCVWAGRWRVQLVEDLPKARELWAQ